jgi:hypothetical protein
MAAWRHQVNVTELKNGDRVDCAIYDDPRSGERYFAVIADPRALTDAVAVAPTGRTSTWPRWRKLARIGSGQWAQPSPPPSPAAQP